MKFERNKMLSITIYIISIIFYTIFTIAFINLINKLSFYYLFITIPMLIMFASLCLTNIIKVVLLFISLLFGRNGNDEIVEFVDKKIINTNRLCKYTLIAIFISLLTSIMVLDIIYCIYKGKYTLIAFSIVIFVLLYYILFKNIIEMIRKEINL